MLKVMIVDNESAIRKGLVHCIKWEILDCFIAAQAEDGIDALEQLSLIQPDIIISDIRMPGMDGLTLAREIHTHHPWIKVIILTGFPDFDYAQKAISYQVVDFVLKPTSVDSLTRAIEKAKSQIEEEMLGKTLKQELAYKEEQNLLLQRDIFLRDLLRGVELSHLHMLNRMAKLGLNLTGYYILRMDISPLVEEPAPLSDEDEERYFLYLKQAQTVLTECLTECTIYFLPQGNQVCYGVVETSLSYPLTRQCNETINILDTLPRFSLSIGISEYTDSPLHMPKAAGQADQAAQFAKYSPEQPVIHISQLPSIPDQIMKCVFLDLRLLKSSIENQNHEKTNDILKKLFSFIRENKLPIDTVRNICLYIHQFCISLLFLPDADGDMSKDSVPELKKLIANTTIDSLEENMSAFVAQMLSRTEQADEQAAQLIQSVKHYIASNYAKDLSLDTLASQVFLSPCYLSRLFKREVGENLSNYVQNVRIEHAKTLLRTTNLKTYQVAERVGFGDPVYFSRIFKKITKIKPKDYREKDKIFPEG